MFFLKKIAEDKVRGYEKDFNCSSNIYVDDMQ